MYGGFRGVYAAGIFDYCLDNGISFDMGFGMSAGAFNIMAYAARQKGRNLVYYSEYGLRKEYASFHNFICKKSFIDLHIHSTPANRDGEYPLDYRTLINNPTELTIVATKADTGKTTYFTKADIKQDDYSMLKASCAIPFVCHPYKVNDIEYFDGALSDILSVRRALINNADKIVLILKTPGYSKEQYKRYQNCLNDQ